MTYTVSSGTLNPTQLNLNFNQTWTVKLAEPNRIRTENQPNPNLDNDQTKQNPNFIVGFDSHLCFVPITVVLLQLPQFYRCVHTSHASLFCIVIDIVESGLYSDLDYINITAWVSHRLQTTVIPKVLWWIKDCMRRGQEWKGSLTFPARPSFPSPPSFCPFPAFPVLPYLLAIVKRPTISS